MKESIMNKTVVSRRGFLSGVGALAAMPAILQSGCVSAKGAKRPLPSERLNVGFIGYGTMGHDNMGNFLNNDRVQVVGVCDPNREAPLYGYNAERLGGREPGQRRVNEFYAQQAGRPAYSGCKSFVDFRELLAMPGLDAVVIATPDHWHAVQAIWAARAGKHIYCQKPMSLSIGQGQAMVREVAKAGVTFQVGSQQRSDTYFRMACEFVRNGRIGKLQRIEIGMPGGYTPWGKKPEELSEAPLAQPPESFGEAGFDLWLGPARKRPFTPAIHRPLAWRWNLDYSGGQITDWGAHHFDIMQWALGRDGSGPVAIENLQSDLPPPDKIYNTAAHYSFEIVYADGTRAFVSDRFDNGVRFVGEGDKEIFVTRGKLVMKPDGLIREKLRPEELHLYVSGQHEKNFVECVFSGQETITPCAVGHRSITIAHLANAGLRLGLKKVQWDPQAERYVGAGADEAAKLMLAPLRGEWSLDPRV
jgi:predicted dehydrogenase